MAFSSPSTLLTSIMRMVLLTLVYFASGWLSLLLAIPPGFVSGIFLPLGISLAALLIWGDRLVVAVLIGSTLLNISAAMDAGQLITAEAFRVAFLIACGSSIACLTGAWLIRRYVGFPNYLTDERNIFLLFILGGPVTAAISASIGTLVLFSHSIISTNQIIFSWGTWWVGDAIGVLIAVPLMCVFFAQPRYFWQNRRATVGVPLVVSSLVVVVIFISASNNEQKKMEVQFRQEASLVSMAVQTSLTSVEQLLATLGGLFIASQDVTREEFVAYVDQIIVKKHGVSGFSWNRLLPHNERNEFEAKMRAQGFENFVIRESISEGDFITSPVRDNYVVITYIEPWEEGQVIHGVNVAANAERFDAIERAARTGKFALTKPLQLLQDKYYSSAVVAFYPVFSLAYLKPGVVAHKQYLMGYATAIVRTNDLIDATLVPFNSADYNLIITDVTDATDPLRFYTEEQVTTPVYAEHLILNDEVTMGGRLLQIRIAPTDFFLSSKQGLQSWFVLVGGLLFCSLLGGFLLLISGRTQHIRNLVEQRTQELAAILENAAEAILVVTGSGGIEKANPAAAALFNYSLENLQQLQIADLVPSLSNLSGAALFSSVVEGGKEQIARRSDGLSLNVELSVSPVDIKERLFFTFIIHDITERKKVEQLKAEFISTVSHELRTPLTSIKGALSVALSGGVGVLDQKMAQLLSIAATNTDRLSRLVNDILDIDKLEFGSANLNFEVHQVSLLLKQATEQHQSYAERYGVSLQLELPDESVTGLKARLDGDRFLQVMSNLISNAIKFSHRDHPVRICMTKEQNRIHIAVIDMGQGIPASFHQRVFTRFAQVDSSDTRKRDGSGLGLSITKALVDRMGGTIDYVSEVGKGTTFYITLPIYDH